MDIGGHKAALIGATFTVDQKLENSDIISGVRYQESLPVRNALREVRVEGAIQYSPQNNLSELFINNTTVQDVEIILRNQPTGGFPAETRWTFPTCQIRTSPDTATAGLSRISQDLILQAFAGNFGADDDYSIVANYSEYDAVRAF